PAPPRPLLPRSFPTRRSSDLRMDGTHTGKLSAESVRGRKAECAVQRSILSPGGYQGEGISVPRMRAEMGSPWSVELLRHAQSPRPVKAGARLCRSPSKPARCFVPEHRFRAGAVRVIGMTVAAELFQGRDLPFRRPLDPGDAVKFFHSAVLHGVPEIPLHHGLPFFMEKLPDVPDQHPTAGVPLLEPVPDRLPPAILRAPALGVDHIFCKDLVDAQILLFEPHLEPQPDAAYPFFHVCVLLILMRSSSMP